MTFEEIDRVYPADRCEMTQDEHKKFVEDCYAAYEEEGFASKFWTPYDQYKDRIGQEFRVLRRVGFDENDIEVLPMWHIEFADGFTTLAYPEEITFGDMVANGYNPMKG
jgi:hypothetical protein